MASWLRGVAATVLIVVFAAAPATAQTGELSIEDVRDAEYPRVEVTVTVPERFTGIALPKEAFTVREEGGAPQVPYLGSSAEAEIPSAPRVVLAIDTSGSMRDSIGRAKEAADVFVAALREGTEVAVVTFGDSTDVLVAPTADRDVVRAKIAAIEVDPDAQTALHDGVLAAKRVGESADTPFNVVALSDGGDTVSVADEAQAVEELQQSGVTFWAVQLPSGEQDRGALERLAGDRGEVFSARDADDLSTIYTGLGADLSRQYVLRYDSEADGRTQISVTLAWRDFTAQTEQTVDITAVEGEGPLEPSSSVARTDPVAATVPLLGTVTAYRLGLVALTIASFVLWLFVLLPRPPRTGERLAVDLRTERPATQLSGLAAWTVEVTDRRLRRAAVGERLDHALEAAGIDIRPGEFVVMLASFAVVVFAIGSVIANAVIGLLLMLILPIGARLWLGVRRDRRQAAFSDQLTDVLQRISGSLRAGHGLTQGIDAVSRDIEEPAAGEFRRIIVEHRLGRDLGEAMRNCATRMDNIDFSWVVQAIAIHREIGGDLAKVLDNIIGTVRSRAEVHRQVRTLSAEGRLSANVLVALPLIVIAFLQYMSPEYVGELTGRPIGQIMIAGSVVLVLVGVLVIRKMVNIRY
jgi:tight adherence protein B